jgi:hypothetical protein
MNSPRRSDLGKTDCFSLPINGNFLPQYENLFSSLKTHPQKSDNPWMLNQHTFDC